MKILNKATQKRLLILLVGIGRLVMKYARPAQMSISEYEWFMGSLAELAYDIGGLDGSEAVKHAIFDTVSDEWDETMSDELYKFCKRCSAKIKKEESE